MRPLTVVGALFLSVSIIAAAHAAPPQKGDAPKSQQGLKNAKKAMQARLERDRKVLGAKKKAIAMRQQSRTQKTSADTGK